MQNYFGADLIPVNKSKIGQEEINSVNLRDVWLFVESKSDFSQWARIRLKRAKEGIDFILNLTSKENLSGGRPTKEYIVTLDYAKSICMLEDNEKGDELRQYFISCEKRLISITQESPIRLCDATEAAIKMAKAFGLKGNQAYLSADKAIIKLTGKSALNLLEIELKAEDNQKLLTPTEIGQLLTIPVSAKEVNKALEKEGLQEKTYDKKGFHWRLTEKGKAFGVYIDTNKKSGKGIMIQQIKWNENIIKKLDYFGDF